MLDKKRNGLLTAAILLTAGFPAGILMIIFGATKSITFLLVAGIILTVAGFYVMPMLWVKYGDTKIYSVLRSAVVSDELYSVKDIASRLGVKEERALQVIKTSLANRYIEGFKLNDDQTALVELVKKEKPKENKTVQFKCSSCGASCTVPETDRRCPYCGSVKE